MRISDWSSDVCSSDLVVVLDDCTFRVVARKADAETVNETFTKVLEGTRRPGLEVRQVSITHTTEGEAHLQTILYYLGREQSESGWGFTATTTDSATVTNQVVLTVSRLFRPEGK